MVTDRQLLAEVWVAQRFRHSITGKLIRLWDRLMDEMLSTPECLSYRRFHQDIKKYAFDGIRDAYYMYTPIKNNYCTIREYFQRAIAHEFATFIFEHEEKQFHQPEGYHEDNFT